MATLDSTSSGDATGTTLDIEKTNTTTTTTTTVDHAPVATSVDTGPVHAYAKLEGQHSCYYIRTLQVTLGRKVNRLDKADKVDIPLANTKSVSRQHARLFYNFTTQRFEMMVIGKNGAFVNDQFIERGITVPLENRTKIAIGETHFIFLLPYMDADDGNNNNNNNNSRNEANSYITKPQQIEKQRKRKMAQQTNALPIANNNNNMDDEDEEEVDEEFKKTMIGYPGVPNPYIGKEDKPPFSYANLIAQAINNASIDKRMTLNEIYTYISTTYPYFKKVSSTGWQNSVRHNLSLNKAFIKMPRSNNDSGKGAFWTIDPKLEYSIFATNVPLKQRNSKRSSGMSSPATSSKDGDDDSNSTNIVTTGPSTKKQRKDKAAKDADDNKGKKETSITPINNSTTTDSMENASPTKTSISNTPTSAKTISSPTIAMTSDITSTSASGTESISQDDKTNISKQRKPSRPKTSVPPAPPTSTTITTPNEPSHTTSILSSPSSSAPTVATSDTLLGTPGPEISANIAKTPTGTPSTVQAQLQLQLQNTIRQHLMDPIRNPLPPTIAQLLPQAIAQLPPQIANQLSSTLNVALRAQEQHRLQLQQQQQSQHQGEKTEKQQKMAETTTDSQGTSTLESTTTAAPLPPTSAPISSTPIEQNTAIHESSTLEGKDQPTRPSMTLTTTTTKPTDDLGNEPQDTKTLDEDL